MSTLKAVNFQHPSATNPAIELESDGSIGGFLGTALDSKLPIAGGKILQIVRATDSTARSTTSATYVDVTGMSVTITPQKSTSAIIIAAVFNAQSAGTTTAEYQIADSSNNAISGAQEVPHGGGTNPTQGMNMWAYATPATTSAVTYKLRFKGDVANQAIVQNDLATGQMYAIEVSA